MPKLDLASSHEYWKNYEDPMIYRVIAFMETVEHFTIDDSKELEESIARMGDLLGELSSFELGKEDQFIALCSHLKTSRILRLLQAIDTIDPGSASKLLMFAEENNSPENPMAELFIRRNIVFERLRLLSRIFAQERIAMVLKVIES